MACRPHSIFSSMSCSQSLRFSSSPGSRGCANRSQPCSRVIHPPRWRIDGASRGGRQLLFFSSRSRVKCYRSGPALLSNSLWTLEGISDIPNWLARLRPDWPSLQLEDSRLVHRGFASNVLPLCASALVGERSSVSCSSELSSSSHGQSIWASLFP